MFFTRDAGTAIFHTNIIATTKRSLLFLPFFTPLLVLLKFQTRTHISRMWWHVIWQIDTSVAQATATSTHSSQHKVRRFPWHCLLPKLPTSSLSYNYFSCVLLQHIFFSSLSIFQHNQSHGWLTALVSLLRALYLDTTTLILLPWKWRQPVPHKHWYIPTKLHKVTSHKTSSIHIHWCENLKFQ